MIGISTIHSTGPDPTGLDKFMIEEAFEDITNSLKAAYYQLFLREADQEGEKAIGYKKRSDEIFRLKSSFSSTAWSEKEQAINELKKEYKNLIHNNTVSF